jgi:hypothetical protein
MRCIPNGFNNMSKQSECQMMHVFMCGDITTETRIEALLVEEDMLREQGRDVEADVSREWAQRYFMGETFSQKRTSFT